MIRVKKASFFYRLILFTAGFFIFLEWLYPAIEVGETIHFRLFIYYAIFCFLITLLQVRWWVSMPLKGIGLLFVIHQLFFSGSFFDMGWVTPFYNELTGNSAALFARDWLDISNLFRSVMFLILIWLMSYLIYYWFIETRRIFIFILLTFIYVGILDTFTMYDATYSIIRIFILSFLSFGMVNLFKEMKREAISFPWFKRSPIWLTPLLFIVILAAGVGIFTPTYGPQWDDPVPFLLKTKESMMAGSGIQKVGYGEDDSQLGGSFLQDDTPVFQVRSQEREYWRIETKDVYTGKGWESSRKNRYREGEGGYIPWHFYSDIVALDYRTAEIEFQGKVNLDKIIYPYGAYEVYHEEMPLLLLDETFGVIRAQLNEKIASLQAYDVSYEKPRFNTTELKNSAENDTSFIKEQYTGLPEQLPDRIGKLAEEITSLHHTRYDKAKAIEQYFNKSGFVYQTEDIPVPRGDEDYVDQFLFETKAGYCDNYSTSMVVMLRSLGIPARWVKGFTGGEKVTGSDVEDDSRTLYQVTNANAHSWVEVYFPDIGWVPFEPTQGFDNLSDFDNQQSDQDIEDLENLENEPEEEENEEEPDLPEIEEIEKVDPNEIETETGNKEEKKSPIVWYSLLGVIVIALIYFGIILYRTRHQRKLNYLTNKFNRKMDAKTFEEVYHYLLVHLGKHGIKKADDQTLREFAAEVDEHYGMNDMQELTNRYEQVLYHDIKVIEDKALSDCWQRVAEQVVTSNLKHIKIR